MGVTALAALMVVGSGIMKLIGSDQVVPTLEKVGVGPYITGLGLMEIGFTALFLYPKTMKIGFVLLSCYFAGAMATELSHNGPVLNAAIPLVLVWVAALLRDPQVLLPSAEA
ncbi:hypothetical protein GCM10027578_19460 [Spirosoma luteolum]